MEKLHIALIFGGKSAEHEVSIRSARTVFAALDLTKYSVTPVAITKKGGFVVGDAAQAILDNNTVVTVGEEFSQPLTTFITALANVDVAFPVLHGPYGEDGSMQGLFEVAGVAYVGAGVLGSAIGMDKGVMKRLLSQAGIPVAKWLVATKASKVAFDEAREQLGLPLFIKPANLGSSIGVSKVNTAEEFSKGIETALRFDASAIIEEAITGREIECAVLGGESPRASRVGEIVLSDDFYSYDEKYSQASKTDIRIPAELPDGIEEKVQSLSVKTFTTLHCFGMGRVDFFLQDDGALLVNEINTLPGFTSISMYPKLWEISGVPISLLVDELVSLAQQRHDDVPKAV
jgi:D-alanine-D-alanine ligase